MSIVYSGDKITFADSSVQSSAGVGFKNRIINGDMRIDQRNAGAQITPTNGQWLVDRWIYYGSQASKFTAQQNAGSVTPPPGFTNYQGLTSTSAYSVGSGENFNLRQGIEGLNVADLAWGTANAKAVTLSFWVYSSLTGTFGGSITNSAGNRAYVFSYSIASANTWTQISVTIPGDTSGTWLTNNGIGIQCWWSLGVGSTLSGTPGSWGSTAYYSATSAVSVVGTSGATFYITGVQLEVGSSASSFEVRDYGRELILCQRYYQGNGAAGGNNTTVVGQATGGGTATSAYILPVVMRTTPALTIPAGGTFSFVTANAGAGAGGTITIAGSSNNQVINFNLSGGSGLSTGNATSLVTSYHGFQLSAEL